MFTGIIEDLGRVISVEKRGSFGRITVETGLPLGEVSIGDSIAVNGACLTVVEKRGGTFSADMSEETLRLTGLGRVVPGERVNLERALTLSKPLGGHLVTGHVDGRGVIRRRTAREGYVDFEFSLPAALMGQLVTKGSVAVDGISLTVASLTDEGFTTAVIPHTLRLTNLRFKGEGDGVNVETDIIGKYVERLLKGAGDTKKREVITEAFLGEHGFLK
ncbi:MAG TPA: riboflavin synthase [Deltaproteobacteria bacterium]|nr:riboflavin synthase [Deltaproteobacteria bacterium]